MRESSALRELLGAVTEMTRGFEPSVQVLQLAIDQLTTAALVADMHGRFVAVNTAAAALTGYPVSELLRLSVWQITPDVPQHEADVLWRAFLARGDQQGEYSLLTKGNRVILADYAAATDILPGLHLSLLRECGGRARPMQRTAVTSGSLE